MRARRRIRQALPRRPLVSPALPVPSRVSVRHRARAAPRVSSADLQGSPQRLDPATRGTTLPPGLQPAPLVPREHSKPPPDPLRAPTATQALTPPWAPRRALCAWRALTRRHPALARVARREPFRPSPERLRASIAPREPLPSQAPRPARRARRAHSQRQSPALVRSVRRVPTRPSPGRQSATIARRVHLLLRALRLA